MESADQFRCLVHWHNGEPMYPGRAYRLQIGGREANAAVSSLRHRGNGQSMAQVPAAFLAQGQSGLCNISLDQALPFAPFEKDPAYGSFMLYDRFSGEAVGSGQIEYALRRAANIPVQHFTLDRATRAGQKAQTPVLLWFTGLSGAGKSTIANLVEQHLFAQGRHSYILDGDNIRHGLCRDLGFTDADRVENIRRVTEVARLMLDAGLIVLTAFISPFRAEREQARQLVGTEDFVEIFVDAPLALAEARDVKGLYRKARSGELLNFTGIDSPYEPPEAPALHLHTDQESAELSAAKVVAFLQKRGVIL